MPETAFEEYKHGINPKPAYPDVVNKNNFAECGIDSKFAIGSTMLKLGPIFPRVTIEAVNTDHIDAEQKINL